MYVIQCISCGIQDVRVIFLQHAGISLKLLFLLQFYPYHYAPFVSDIKGISNLQLEFEQGEPFLPFQQLLAVLQSVETGLAQARPRGRAFQTLSSAVPSKNDRRKTYTADRQCNSTLPILHCR